MISVLLKGYIYKNDFYELIRVFFPKLEVRKIQSIDEWTDGYLVDISLEDEDKVLFAHTRVFYEDKLLSSHSLNIDKYNIYREREKTIKNGIKTSIYKALITLSDVDVPWGILTGIRPTKVVHELIEKKVTQKDILDILTNSYMLSMEKAQLLLDISMEQGKYIYPEDKDKYSLYIGIPFCPTRCIYCSFATFPIGRYSSLVDDYVDKLIYEIKCIEELMKGKRINTVYIGGGTPTALPIPSLERIIKKVNESFLRENIKEFTVEAGRPDTINMDVLKMLKNYHVDRISINPQTMNDKTLKLIGRKHSSKDIVNAYEMAKSVGFKSVNMDLIVGLPEEDLISVRNTLKMIKEMDPENLTVHTLSVKRGSEFKDNLSDYHVKEQDMIQNMLDETMSFTRSNGFAPYYLYRQKNILGNFENIGYSKKDHECIYNISIMEEKETIIGAGVGSTTKVYNPEDKKLERIFNFKDIKEYSNRIDEIIQRKRRVLTE